MYSIQAYRDYPNHVRVSYRLWAHTSPNCLSAVPHALHHLLLSDGLQGEMHALGGVRSREKRICNYTYPVL